MGSKAGTSKRIVISGYYGFNNSGDEAVLKSILAALEEQAQAEGIAIEPIVLSADPALTTRLYGVQAVQRMKLGDIVRALRESDGLISGGGSLLQDATSAKSIPYYLAIVKIAQWLGKPSFIYAQGIGPVRRKLFYGMIRRAFRKCAYVSVRDQESAELLVAMGVARGRIDVVPDPVMGLPLPDGGADAEARVSVSGAESAEDDLPLPLVGVSVRYWNEDRSDLDRCAEALALLCKRSAVHLRFLPFHLPSDEEASRYVIDRIGQNGGPGLGVDGGGSRISICPPLQDPQGMLAEVSRCDLLIGMRLHSLIYAASQSVPLLGISYDPKIDHFLHRLNSVAVGTTAYLDPQATASEAARLLAHGAEWRRSQAAGIERLKQESQLPAKQIVRYLRLNKG